jgi:exonuclease SbcD
MPGMAARASSVDIFQTLAVPDVIVGNKDGHQVVTTKRGPVFLAWMPYPMRNRLLSKEEHHGKSIEELNNTLREMVTNMIGDLAVEAKSHNMPRILAGHFSVDKAHYGSERSVLLGKEITVQTSTLADPAWDYIALGHIHRHQDLSDGVYPPVVYSGSLERIDFGEEKEQKGFCWIELIRGGTQWRFVPVESRPFHTIQIDVRGSEDPKEIILKKLERISVEGSIVRVKINMEANQQTTFQEREIYKALDGATSITILRDVEEKVRPRLYGVSLETLVPIELVEQYFQSKDLEPERIRSLLEKVEEILSDPD